MNKIILIVMMLGLGACSILTNTFKIPASSMLPTINKDEWIYIDDCFPPGCNVSRGDIVLFFNPEDGKTKFLKRVLGVSGDTVSYTNGELKVNGEVIADEFLNETVLEGKKYKLFAESISGKNYRIIKSINSYGGLGDGIFYVENGHVFVLGDNRDGSKDSRYIGLIPLELIIGKYEE